MYDVILSFITAFMLTYFAVPAIIRIAEVKHLFDEPGDRSSHSTAIPSLGGIAIFAGVLFSIIFWTPFDQFSGVNFEDAGQMQYILCSFIIIFLIGAKDDIEPISPTKKFLGEILAAIILVFKANIKITSLYGIFGIYDLPEFVSIMLSLFTIILIINAFNLIDGINGLCGSIGTLISITFGIWFTLIDRLDLAIIAFSMAGSIVAFLKYNYSPAKIFMGDTGSLLLGLVAAILVIKFIEINKTLIHQFAIDAVPAVGVGILIIPLFDTLRVFIMRALRGRSPFHPDRNHIHHLLIDLNFSHTQATGILVFVNLAFIVFVFTFRTIGVLNLLFLVLALATTLSSVLYLIVRKKRISKTSKN